MPEAECYGKITEELVRIRVAVTVRMLANSLSRWEMPVLTFKAMNERTVGHSDLVRLSISISALKADVRLPRPFAGALKSLR
jgi:hypothetical protein